MAVDYSDDRDLVEALQARDEAAFAWLLDTYDATLRRVARALAPDRADDVVHATWLAVIDGIDTFELRSTVKTWVFRTLLDRADARFDVPAELDEDVPAFDPRRFRTSPGPTKGLWRKDGVPAPWGDRESPAVVAAAVADLPAPRHTVLCLRDVDGWTTAEVCDLLDLSETSQRVLLHRARAHVRHALEDGLA